MTVTSPLEHLIAVLNQRAPGSDQVGALRAIAGLVEEHNAPGASPADQARLWEVLAARMRQMSTVGRTTLAGDLYLDCQVSVPAGWPRRWRTPRRRCCA